MTDDNQYSCFDSPPNAFESLWLIAIAIVASFCVGLVLGTRGWKLWLSPITAAFINLRDLKFALEVEYILIITRLCGALGWSCGALGWSCGAHNLKIRSLVRTPSDCNGSLVPSH